MARKSNGEGSIVKDPRGNGKYIARIQIGYTASGNPKIKSFSGYSIAEVKRRLKEYKKERENDIMLEQAEGLLAESLFGWLKKYKQPFVKPSTYDRLIQTAESNVIPYIGQYPVKQITAGDIQANIINRMKTQGLSLSSIRKAYQLLNGFFGQYVKERCLLYNPLDGVVMPTKQAFDAREIHPLTAKEMEEFEQTATSRWKSSGLYRYKYGFGLVFILYTGLRMGEALALQYKHVDIENKRLTVEQNLIVATDGTANKYRRAIIQRSTKTASGKREIPLCDKAVEAFKLHKELYYKGNDEDFIFTTKNGTHLKPDTIIQSANTIFRTAGIQASGIHILRHSFASYLYDKGVDIKVISKLLGHSGVQITSDIYVHTNFSQLEKAVDILN